MDRKALFQAILWSVAAYMLYMMIVGKLYPPQPPPGAPTTTQPAAQPTVQPGAPSSQSALPKGASVQPPTPAPGGLSAAGADERLTFVLGSTEGGKKSPYRAEIAFTNLGASIDTVLLSDYKKLVNEDDPYALLAPARKFVHLGQIAHTFQGQLDAGQLTDDLRRAFEAAAKNAALSENASVRVETPGREWWIDDGDREFAVKNEGGRLRIYREDVAGTLRSLTFETILLDNVELRLDEVLWRASREDEADSQTATFECDVVRDGQPIIRLQRRFILNPAPANLRRYDLNSELTVQNLTDRTHEVRITQRGPVGIRQEDRRVDDRRVNVGIFLEGAVQPHKATQFADIAKNTGPLKLFGAQDDGRLWWVAAENKYFAFVTTPVKPDGGEDPGIVYAASAADRDGDAETADDAVLQLVLGPFTLPARGSTTLHMEHYLGPKDKQVFLEDRNADYVRRNYYLLNQDQGMWCTFGWLTELMVTLLNAFSAVVHNYGIAIFLLVLLVRVILHPVTKKTQVNMVKMQQSMGKLQPKIEEAKKRYANDKQRLQQETMRIYKEAGINPAGQMLSCLPMMLQMPIWVALYSSLNNNIAMRHQGFVWWINDLTAPDALIPLGGSYHVPLLGAFMGEVTAFNLLPLLVGATMYAQQKLMPKAQPAATPSSDQSAQMQKQMQSMMPIMSIFMALIFYNMPSGLNLYIMTSSVLGAIEQWRIRMHVEAAKSKSVDVPAPSRPQREHAPAKPRRPSFLERLAKKADEAQKLRKTRK